MYKKHINIVLNITTKALRGHVDLQIAKVNRYIGLCNPFSRIENPFLRIINSFPRNRQLFLSDCNAFDRFQHPTVRG